MSKKHPFHPTFKQRVSLNLLEKYMNLEAKVHDLKYLFWECTLRCNIQCIHCGSDCRTDNNSKDMPAEDYLKVAEQISKKYNPNKIMMVITGGEPLMRTDLEKIGMQLYQLGFPWGMVTNGFALSENRFLNLRNAGLRSITISLDGEETEHNWLRGHQKSYQKAIEAIETVVSMQDDIAFDVVTCINARNFDKLESIKQLLIYKGVKFWRIFTISPIGRAKENRDLHISDKQFLELMKFIESCRLEGKIIASFGCEGFLGSFEGKVRDGYYMCRAGISIGSILNDGSISACPNNDKSMSQGNIYTDDFIDVWENRYGIMRNRSWTKTGICSQCEVYDWCKGNGLHLRDLKNKTVMRCHYQMLENGLD